MRVPIRASLVGFCFSFLACGIGSGSGGVRGGVRGGVDGGSQNNVPVYTQAACGSLVPENPSASTNIDSPTSFPVNTPISARIDPDSATNQRHYWEVSLPAGSYHLVVDEERVDNRDSTVGLKFKQLDSLGVEVATVIRGNEIDYKFRAQAFFTLDRDTLFTMSVEPRFGAEDYVFGIFGNGTGVPSPFFENCPTFSVLPIGTATPIPLAVEADPGFEVWYTVDIGSGDFRFTVDATRQDGVNGNIIYAIDAFDQFGQKERIDKIGRINEINTTHRSSELWGVTESKSAWIRFRNANAALNLSFIVTPE